MDAEGSDEDPSLPIVTSKWIKRLLFLGTGTSGQVPALGCLLHKPSSVEEEIRAAPCVACHDAIRPGSKNKRGCTSAAIIGQSRKSDQESLVLIDCGPSFYTSILQHIDAQKLGRIDAILLTHAHADALLGLDSLRSWTMGGVVQDYVDVYCTEECFGTIRNMFPYLVDKSKSTGGGGVGDVRFHIIDSHKPFQVDLQTGGGDRIEVNPLPAHHGQNQGRPFECLGFRIDSLSYISDCHYIPSSTVDLMAGSQVIVMDALNPYRHASHFSLPQALSFTLSFPSPAPRLALLTDITHNLEHYKTEREVQIWREKLQAWRIDQNKRNKGRTELVTAQVGKGEAGGPRWWHGKWDERLSERRGAGLVLLDDTPNGPEPEPAAPVPTGKEHNNRKDKEAAARPKEKEGEDLLLPQIHLAWDGMLVSFQVST